MAQKKTSQAEKTVKNSGRKKSASKAGSAKKKSSKYIEEEEAVIPYDAGVVIVCMGLMVLFIVIILNPEGALLRAIYNMVTGLIGVGSFYLSIPAMVCMMGLHTFGKHHQPVLRGICTIGLLLICGAIFHLVVQTQGMASGVAIIKDLYASGSLGDSGGVICGGMAELARWALGNIGSYIVFGFGAILCLLGIMQITIPSLIHAIANRPRDEEWEEEEDYVEPAVAVVNHIANRQIEHKRQRRQRKAEEQLSIPQVQVLSEEPEETPEPVFVPEPEPETPQVQLNFQLDPPPRKPARPVQPAEPVMITATEPVIAAPANASSVMNEICLDTSTPLVPPSEKNVPFNEMAFRMEAPIIRPQEDPEPEIPDFIPEEIPTSMPELELDPPSFAQVRQEPVRKPVKVTRRPERPEPVREQREERPAPRPKAPAAPQPCYTFPPIDLLHRPVGTAADGTEEMRENSKRLNETLASFRIDAHIINVTRGPSVTRYEVELDKGVRLSKLTGCADDIALSLGASGVRIAAVPGKISIVGIEVPNRSVTMVSLREVIDSPEFARAKSKSSFAVGKDISGSCIVGNIAKMPHLLIAGTTGSGKSVCMNSIILSLLYKAAPEEVKLIMVDPKMVELGIYNGIPHLLIPVVTDPKKAAGSLQWAVTEMMRRYKMMSDSGVRDLESYNSIMASEEDGKTLPQVVVIIDELADLMLVAAKEVEDSICRIAQMGRAAGMHLIIATQRPSADVITGLMKANIPSRIAFSVASAMESRIILDTVGAEKLVGKGDMLFAPIGIGKPLRVQGCFVADSEVEAVAEFVKQHYTPDYDEDVLQEIEKKAQQTGKKGSSSAASDFSGNSEETEGDEMLPAAVDVIMETGQASVSMLQRRLKLGYARAARIVDEMEERGIVGPFQGSKPRSILITKEQWEAQKNGGSPDEY